MKYYEKKVNSAFKFFDKMLKKIDVAKSAINTEKSLLNEKKVNLENHLKETKVDIRIATNEMEKLTKFETNFKKLLG